MSEPSTPETGHGAMTIPWDDLRRRAIQVAGNAYAPWSGFRVGAAGITDRGEILAGCNVENASYGVTLCAECSLVSAVHSQDAGTLVAVVVVTDDGSPCPPCGRCRQLLLEHGGAELLVDGDGTPRPMAELLPGGFTGSRLTGPNGEHPGGSHEVARERGLHGGDESGDPETSG